HLHRHRGVQLAAADVSEPFARQANGALFLSTPKFTRFYVAGDTVCGLDDGISAVSRCLGDIRFEARVLCCDQVSKCFSDTSNVFETSKDRASAKRVVEDIGLKLRPDKPLGYQDSQMLVVFHDNCPNNTLPILWAKPENHLFEWNPLFLRV
ncbi:MAG: hypothetical protein AB7V06_17815, partial [Candidatus Obscuribacterales bacterium]